MQFKKLIFQSVLWRGLYFLTVFILNIFISRNFFATGSGWVYYISNSFSFVLLIAGLCLESGMGFYGSRNEIPYAKLSILSMVWTMIVSIITLSVLFLHPAHPKEVPDQSLYNFFCLTYICGILLTTYYSALFYAKQDFVTPNLVLVITDLLLILIFPLAIYTGNRNFIIDQYLNFYFITFLVQGILISLLFIWKHNHHQRIQLPANEELIKIFKFSTYSLLANVVYFLLYRMDYWFVKNYCSVCQQGDLGNYIQVSKLVQVFLVLPTILSSTIFPRTAAGFREEMNASIQVLSRMIIFFYLILLTLLAIAGKWLFPFIFGVTFNHMVKPFIFLIPGVLALSVLSFLAAYNGGKGKIITNLKGAVIPLIIMIVGDSLFIPRYGIEAASVISSLGYIAYLLHLLYIFKREYNVRVADFFLFTKSDWRQVISLFKKRLWR